MRSGVDEIRECDEGGGKADGGAVQSRDEDLGVCVEGLCDVEIVGDEALEPEAALVFVGGLRAAD